ncbi:MAG TPA: hypothetical protein VGB08_10435 [Allosphingosinicella sp.]
MRAARAEEGVNVPIGFGEDWDRLQGLRRDAESVLSGLDELGLHQAAAYLSMALDVIREARPGPLPTA